ncbi:MAG: DUF4270 family protein [Bacteroidota bacterium]
MLRKRLKMILIGTPLGIMTLFSGCNEDVMLAPVGEIVTPLQLSFTDTVDLTMATRLVDSLVTSGTGTILVGSYRDEKLGLVVAQPFFQLGLNGTLSLSENAVFDSLVLYLTSGNYYYNDLDQEQHWQLHQLTEELLPQDDTYFYNTQALTYSDSTIGEIFFVPSLRDSLAMRVSDSWGKALFELAISNDPVFQNAGDFQDYLPGFTMIADTAMSNSILGYSATPESVYMRLYYHESAEEKLYFEYDFPLTNSNLQFNHIATDRSASQVASLSFHIEPLPDSSTYEETFVQAGAGVITQIAFPYLENFMELGEYLYITNAELVVEPVINTRQELPLPDSLYLIRLENQDDIIPALSLGITSASAQSWVGPLQLDEEYDQQTQYRFNVTAFIQAKLDDPAISDELLLLTIPDFNQSVSRLYLGGSQHEEYHTRLEITYLQLDNLIDE